MKLYHTNEHREKEGVIEAKGFKQWLGDGFYFWQDYEFAKEWAIVKNYQNYDIYSVDVELTENNMIDTVFNEEDYYNFVEKLELFADKYFKLKNRKPDLEEFNNFIKDNKIWGDIKAIRFQDLPTNNNKDYLKINNFYYKKRIQIVLYDAKKIKSYKFETFKR